MTEDRFRSRYGPWAIVAGASEGLGEAFSRALARRGLNLILIARREGPLSMLADELRRSEGVEALAAPLDLASPDLVERLEALAGEREVGLLVYNACLSVIGPFLEQSLEQKQKTLDVNCRGPLLASSWAAPKMVARGRGGILLMSSMAGFQGTAMVGTYAATKAFDTVLGESLWEELRPHGVDVLVCAAGATLTPNFRAQTPADKQAGAFPLRPEQVAEEALTHLGEGPTWIPGRINRLAGAAMRALPRRAAVRFMSRSTRGMYQEGPSEEGEPGGGSR